VLEMPKEVEEEGAAEEEAEAEVEEEEVEVVEARCLALVSRPSSGFHPAANK